MKKRFLSLALLLVLVGCNNSNHHSSIFNSSSNNQNTSQSTSDYNVTSSIDSSFSSNNCSSNIVSSDNSSSDSNISISNQTLYDIHSCKVASETLVDKVNDYGVCESNIDVEIKGKVLARFDAITTKSGYGNRYKILVANLDQYIYLKVSKEVYDQLENNIGSSYLFKGKLSYYCGEVEVTLNQDLIDCEEIVINDEELFLDKSIDEIHNQMMNLKTNIKGCAISSLVSFKGKYLAAMDDQVLLFSNGNKIIFVHGPNKFKNSLVVNSIYQINGAISLYNYRPGIEYVSSSVSNDTLIDAIDTSKLSYIDSTLYDISYKTDTNDSYLEYRSLFTEFKLFKGYVNLYYKNNSGYLVLDSQYHQDEYSTYTSASSNKALFIKNENCTNLYSDQDYINSPLIDYVNENIEVEMVLVPYLWNTNKYWQVYFLENSLKEL